MLIGNNDDIARIIRPPPGRDKGRYQLVLVNNVLLTVIFAFNSLDKQAEKASIIVRFMIKHEQQSLHIIDAEVLVCLCSGFRLLDLLIPRN